jgi:hypothetical protein
LPPDTILAVCPYCETSQYVCLLPEATPVSAFCGRHGWPVGQGATIAEAVEDWNKQAEAVDLIETQQEVAKVPWTTLRRIQ